MGTELERALDEARNAPRAIVSFRRSPGNWILFLAHGQFHIPMDQDDAVAAAEVRRQVAAHNAVLRVRG